MLFDVHLNIEVAVRTASDPTLSLASHLETLPVINTGGNVNFYCGLFDSKTGAGALTTRILHNFTNATAGVTGAS
jgi:hypothetical protein